MVDRILQGQTDSKIMILAPVVRQKKLNFERFFQDMQTQGFIRFKVDGVLYEAEADKWMNTLYLHIESLYSSNN